MSEAKSPTYIHFARCTLTRNAEVNATNVAVVDLWQRTGPWDFRDLFILYSSTPLTWLFILVKCSFPMISFIQAFPDRAKCANSTLLAQKNWFIHPLFRWIFYVKGGMLHREHNTVCTVQIAAQEKYTGLWKTKRVATIYKPLASCRGEIMVQRKKRIQHEFSE